MIKSPFKFLDSYTKDDRDIFFGRDREIEELYQRIFESRLLLVYGVSGTGKSSLIHCGLANKFSETDWLPLLVRRGDNIIESMAAAGKGASITEQQNNYSSPSDFKKGVRSLYLDHYKPVFFIFDQLEELFIFGNREEDQDFVNILKMLLASDIQCKFIIILREEFLACLTTFEKSIPGFFSNRMRVEKMDITNAIQVIEGPCKINNITVEEGFSHKMLDKLCPPEENEIELTYLQVFLDRIFRLTSEKSIDDTASITFRMSDLDKAGNVYDIIGSFLDEQIGQLPDPDIAMTVLKAFVSSKGTKRPASIKEIVEYIKSTGKSSDEKTINEFLISFVNLRILQEKSKDGKYELRHDAIAAKIFEKVTLVEKELLDIRQLIENSYHSWEKRDVLLSGDDLQYIAPYESRLYLPDEHRKFIERSKKDIARARQRRRNFITAAIATLIMILSGFTFWAVRERGKAIGNERIANEERANALASEKEAILARDNAIESDRKAVASERDAVAAMNRAEQSEIAARREKELAVTRERQARANNFNYLSKEIVTVNPTVALRLAEYALTLDPENKTIRSNLNRIYYDNSFYKVFFRYKSGNLGFISPDWTKIVTTNGRSAELTDLKNNTSRHLTGHLVQGFVLNDPHGFSRKGYDNILSVAISPDGKFILTGSNDLTARLWDMNGNNLRIFRGHASLINSVEFSPDGKTVLTGSGDLTARIWDLDGNCTQILKGHTNEVLSVAFSPDGEKILTGSADSTAILWDLKGNILKKFIGHTGLIRTVAFSGDGQSILTGSNDQTARLWDLEGLTLKVFTGHEGYIRSLAFSPDNKYVLTGSADKTARLWDLDGNIIQILKGHDGTVNSVFFSPDGKRILTSCSDGISRIWDISENIYRNFTGHRNYVSEALFTPDGKTIITSSADGTLRLWDLEGNSKEPVRYLSNSIAVSPDGKSILAGLLTAQILDLTGKPLKTFVGQQRVSAVAFSPDSKTILTGSPDRSIRLWDLDQNVLATFTGHAGPVTSLAFSPDGKRILTGSADNTARLWDLKGNALQVFTGHTDEVTSVAFSPDGETILTGSDDRTARMWDRSGNTIRVYVGHTSFVNSVKYSPDGNNIITGSSDKTVRFWDADGNTLQVLGGYNSSVFSVAFSPDGKTILTGSGDNIARLVGIKKPLNLFLTENGSEKLNLTQTLEYEITGFEQLNTENDIDRILEGVEFCLSRANLMDAMSEKYLEEAELLLRKSASLIKTLKQCKRYTASALVLLENKSQKYFIDRINELNLIFLSSASGEELKYAYESLSETCSNSGPVIFSTRLPEYLIMVSEKLMSVDTSVLKTISLDLAGLTYPLIQNRQFGTAMNAASLALISDSTNQYLYETLPLVMLMNNKYDEAAELYQEYYKKNMFGYIFGSYRTIYLSDIEDLEKRGIKHPDFDRIKEVLDN